MKNSFKSGMDSKAKEILDSKVAETEVSEQCPDEQPLPSESEEELVMCLKTTEWGKIATKTDVLNLVALYVMENKGKNSTVGKHLEKFCHFVDNRPNAHWLEDFLSRHSLTLIKDDDKQVVVETILNDNTVTSSDSHSKANDSDGERAAKRIKMETNEEENTTTTTTAATAKRERRSKSFIKVEEGEYKFSKSNYEWLQKNIICNNYYAVYYGDGVHYVGYVFAIKKHKVSMRFMHRKPGRSVYEWPKQEDVDENIDPKYIFVGPIKVDSEPPFKILGLVEATKEYCRVVEEA